jgi:hypothetical protein
LLKLLTFLTLWLAALCSSMPTVTAYSNVRMLDSNGKLSTFAPLRAAGLAVEKGHELCRAGGPGKLQAQNLRSLELKNWGGLQVKSEDRFRSVQSCGLQVRAQDADLAKTAVAMHRVFFSEIDLNITHVLEKWPGKVNGRGGNYDLVGDFASALYTRNWGCSEKVWVELKLMAEKDFAEKCWKFRQELRAKLALLQPMETSLTLGAVMMVVVKCYRDRQVWKPRVMLAQLLLAGAGEDQWKTLAGTVPSNKVSPGRLNPVTKPGLQELWGALEKWYHPDTGELMHLLKQFLDEMKLPSRSLKKRMVTFHAILAEHGNGEEFEMVKFTGRAGSRPWAGTRDMYRTLWRHL